MASLRPETGTVRAKGQERAYTAPLENTQLAKETQPHRPASWRRSSIFRPEIYTLTAGRMCALGKTNCNFKPQGTWTSLESRLRSSHPSGTGSVDWIQRCSYCFIFVCWKIIKLINKQKSPTVVWFLGFLSSNFLDIPSVNSSNSNLKMPRTEHAQMSQSLLRLTFFLHHCQSASRFGIKEGYTPGEMLSAGPHANKEEKKPFWWRLNCHFLIWTLLVCRRWHDITCKLVWLMCRAKKSRCWKTFFVCLCYLMPFPKT